MVLIAQEHRTPRNARLVVRLIQNGHRVLLANTLAEAHDLLQDLRPDVVVVDEPRVDRCPEALCAWIRQTLAPAPALVGVVRIDDPGQRARCQRCMTLVPPDTPPSRLASAVESLLTS